MNNQRTNWPTDWPAPPNWHLAPWHLQGVSGCVNTSVPEGTTFRVRFVVCDNFNPPALAVVQRQVGKEGGP
jgi:hypothetical protein